MEISLKHPGEALNPTAGHGLKIRTRTRIRWNRTRLPSIFLSRPSLGQSILKIAFNAAGRDDLHSLASASRAVRSVYKSPEPDVIHEPQHQKHRYNIRSAGT